MYAVVQVRGVVNTNREIKDTLKMLRLHHVNHCVLDAARAGDEDATAEKVAEAVRAIERLVRS